MTRHRSIERPFRQLHETFLPEVELDGIPPNIGELNARAQVWLAERAHAVPSRSTGVAPAERAVVEREFLALLPRVRFDTDYVETRRVHNIVPFISVDGVRYSVPPNVLGQLVEIRRAVDSDVFEIWAGTVVDRHQLAHGDVAEVWPTITAGPRSPKRSAATTAAGTGTCAPSIPSKRPANRADWISGPVTTTSTPPTWLPATPSTMRGRARDRPLRTDQDRPRLPAAQARRRGVRTPGR